MKKIQISKKIIPQVSFIVFSILLIAFATLPIEKADAQAIDLNVSLYHDFGGKFTQDDVCCNGIKLTIQDYHSNNETKTYMLGWLAMVTSLKASYMPISQYATLGMASTIEGQCETIDSECDDEESTDYSFNSYDFSELGTNSMPI